VRLRLYSRLGSPKEVGLLIYSVQTDQGLKATPPRHKPGFSGVGSRHQSLKRGKPKTINDYWRRSGVGRYLSPAMRMNSRKLRRPTSRLNVAMTYFELTVLITQNLPSFVTD